MNVNLLSFIGMDLYIHILQWFDHVSADFMIGLLWRDACIVKYI